jgi:undecaprenyl-diphosphatase
MDLLPAIILGAVQGLTEFLPVSSTGHLILARDILGLQHEFGLAVDAVLHLATALAILCYFWSDFKRLLSAGLGLAIGRSVDVRDQHTILALLLGTVPAVVLGLTFKEHIGTTLRDPLIVAAALLVGSLLFLFAEHVLARYRNRNEQRSSVTPQMGLLIGFFQALALIPGISRSGATISGGLLLGFSREESARFAFLLSFPIILGAGSLSFVNLGEQGFLSTFGFELMLSGFSAFVTAIIAIHYLLKYLKNHSLLVFAVYRVVLAGIIIFYSGVLY